MTYQPRLTVFEPRRPITTRDDARIKELHEAGQTPDQIAQAVGRTHPVIYRRLRAMDLLPPAKKHRNPRPIPTAETNCKRCTVILARTPRPPARGLCCYCQEEGH